MSDSWRFAAAGHRYTVDVTLPGELICQLDTIARKRNCNPRDLIKEAVEIFVAERHRLELRGNLARDESEEGPP
jgi:metal-responsive CopG/Arc/MetJ family transcriptional regulator